MVSARLVPIALAAVMVLPGCVASTAASLVTAPVRMASSGIDRLTTSQSESDEKRGRALRHHEERLGWLQRQYDNHTRQCMRGDEDACNEARADYGEMQNLRAAQP